VVVQEDASIPVESAIVSVELAGGGTVREPVAHGRGTPGRPMSDDELDAKVRELAAFGAPAVDADRIIAAIRGLAGGGDVAPVIAMLVPPGEAPASG